jgi:integrase/recombinase XerD
VKVAQCVEAYLDQKRAHGYALTLAGKFLRRFVRIFGDQSISAVEGHHLDEFLFGLQISNNAWYLYSGHLRRLFEFWFLRGRVKRVPQPHLKRPPRKIFYPHVYSRAEIRKLLDATAACQRSPTCTLTPSALKTLVLFLYGTGVKLRGALAMLDSDVDFRNSTIRLPSSSASQSRVIPIGRDVRKLLRRHVRDNKRLGFGTGRPLFMTTKGASLRYSVFCKIFQRLRSIAQLGPVAAPCQPRIYDLRHTFAVHSIAQWNRKGIQVDRMLPLVAAYMGNIDLLGMERYLQLTPETFRRQLRRLTLNRVGAPQ